MTDTEITPTFPELGADPNRIILLIREIRVLEEQLRLANIDAFNAEAKLGEVRRYIDEADDVSSSMLMRRSLRRILDATT
jgi:hypothetical protein